MMGLCAVYSGTVLWALIVHDVSCQCRVRVIIRSGSASDKGVVCRSDDGAGL